MRVAEVITPIAVALVFITLMSVVKEPMRRSLMAIIVAGAGGLHQRRRDGRMGIRLHRADGRVLLPGPRVLPLHWHSVAAAHGLGCRASFGRASHHSFLRNVIARPRRL